jgi:predicted DNA-binding transcriptional regulator AlpA
MSLITQAFIAEKYGMRIGVKDLAKLLGISEGATYNQLSAGTFPITTYLDAGKRWADYRDVAAHFDKCYEAARSTQLVEGRSA